MTGTTSSQDDTPSPSATALSDNDVFDSGVPDTTSSGASAAGGSLPSSRPSRYTPEFDSSVNSTKFTWKEKRLHLCEYICKHSHKTLSKDVKLSSTRQGAGAAKRCRRQGRCDGIKLTFHLSPYGIGCDEGRFMSMKVGVRVDHKCPQLKEMATLHIKITTKLPATEFVSVRTASNRLEDFTITNFIPHEVIINQYSKHVEFVIEAYLNFDLHHISMDMSEAEEKELMSSLSVIDDDFGGDSNEQFVHVGNGQ